MTDKLSDNVGRKIVEALKMQNNFETTDNDYEVSNEEGLTNIPDNEVTDDSTAQDAETGDMSSFASTKELYQNQFNTEFGVSQISIDNAFQQSLNNNVGNDIKAIAESEIDCPQNVAILNSLIAKLPSGVSKQTGALIIKQTMEALGIPMVSVLQDAKHVQETYVENVKECQRNIIEYKKQINILEHKSQVYQRQSFLLNDIINLFNKLGI